MDFDAEPNYLLLRGSFTDKGLASLAGLDGLFALNLDDRKLAVTAAGLKRLMGLPHLSWLGFDANDGAMDIISAMPRLRMLMCQDTAAGDDGFAALSRSQTIEYVWGRRCYNLTGRGFASLAVMPAWRGLSVSCRNVDDAALAGCPAFRRSGSSCRWMCPTRASATWAVVSNWKLCGVCTAVIRATWPRGTSRA